MLYEKHHNIIDGVYLDRKPSKWIDIPFMDKIDADDEEGELYALFQDAKIYDIDDIKNFDNPTDEHNIKETIFIIRNDGSYYLCETQGDNYIKFASNISNVEFIKLYDRMDKIIKLQSIQMDGDIKPLF
jgi:hypothetical protein